MATPVSLKRERMVGRETEAAAICQLGFAGHDDCRRSLARCCAAGEIGRDKCLQAADTPNARVAAAHRVEQGPSAWPSAGNS